MQQLGGPYPGGYDQLATQDLDKQAQQIAANLAKDGIEITSDREIIALIAYLQRLGTDIKATSKTVAK